MKEYIIPIEDIIVKPELFYAHCDRGNGKNPEILKEHVGRCYHYFEELWEHKNFKAIFENFQKELAPELSDEGIKLFYSLIVNVIIFHDYGKINPRFQSIKMKNTLKKWTVIDCLEGTNHSMLSAAIYLDYFYEKIQEIPLSELHPFKNHPFKVKDDEAMMETADSVRQYGVLVPAIARPDPEGGYELVAGHRRHRASELAEKETMPVIVRDLDDDAATIIMVDSNLQRESLLPSERAFAYKMKLVAMSHQGRKGFTSAQLGRKCVGKESRELIAEQVGQSRNQISRYIRLTELIPEILEMVDNRKMALNPAVSISYLDKKQQRLLYKVMVALKATPSISQAKAIREKASESDFTEDYLVCILSEKKPNQREPMIVEEEEIKQYFPSHYNSEQMHNTILLLIRNWSKKRGYTQ